jgi:hypothetical protein
VSKGVVMNEEALADLIILVFTITGVSMFAVVGYAVLMLK